MLSSSNEIENDLAFIATFVTPTARQTPQNGRPHEAKQQRPWTFWKALAKYSLIGLGLNHISLQNAGPSTTTRQDCLANSNLKLCSSSHAFDFFHDATQALLSFRAHKSLAILFKTRVSRSTRCAAIHSYTCANIRHNATHQNLRSRRHGNLRRWIFFLC